MFLPNGWLTKDVLHYLSSSILSFFSVFIYFAKFSKGFISMTLGLWIKNFNVKECSFSPTLKSPSASIRDGFVSPSQIWDSPRARFEHAQSQSSDFDKRNGAVVITSKPQRRKLYSFELYSLFFSALIYFATFSKGFILMTLNIWIKSSNVRECPLSPSLKSPSACIRSDFVWKVSLQFLTSYFFWLVLLLFLVTVLYRSSSCLSPANPFFLHDIACCMSCGLGHLQWLSSLLMAVHASGVLHPKIQLLAG